MFSSTPLTPMQRLHKGVVDIIHNDMYRDMSGVLMIGDRTLDETIPTACTDGKNEKYNPEFIDNLSDPQLRFLILHENYHKMYRHLTTWRWMFEEHPQLANIACDFFINIRIHDDNKDSGFAVMPPDGCFDEKYRGWDSPSIYADLRKQCKKCGTCGGSGKDPNAGEQQGQGGGQDEQQGKGGQCPDCGGSGLDTQKIKVIMGGKEGFDQHDWEGAQEMSAEEKRELMQDIDQAIRQGALLAGKTGSGGNRDIKDLLEPQIDWREVLRDFIMTTCAGKDFSTWRRPNRRFISSGHYLPSAISEKVESLLIGGDMSGSIGDAEQRVILSEANGVLDAVKPEKIHMVYWDTAVCQHEEYEGNEVGNFVNSTNPKGGGGTNVECVPEFMAKNAIQPQAAIIITDGYLGGSWGQWNCPVLWIIVDNKGCTAPHGTTLHIKTSELR